MDLARLTDKRQFAFVDGLSELFYNPTTATATPRPSFPGTAAPRTVLPVRSQPSPVPARTPQPVPRPGNVSTNPASREIGPVKRLHLSGNGTAALDALERDIATVIKQLKAPIPGEADEPEVLLILDQPDLLLAATGPSKGIGATEMGDWVMGLQQVRAGHWRSPRHDI